jgi:hypothetical protein
MAHHLKQRDGASDSPGKVSLTSTAMASPPIDEKRVRDDAVTARYTGPYSDEDDEDDSKRWYRTRRFWAAAVFLILAVVIAVPVAITTIKNQQWKNRYPDYSQLSYTLSETYGGETFFNNFDYFEGYDPCS